MLSNITMKKKTYWKSNNSLKRIIKRSENYFVSKNTIASLKIVIDII